MARSSLSFTNTLSRTLAWMNAAMKSTCLISFPSCAAAATKVFNRRMDAVGDHVSSPGRSFCRSPLTTILVFSLLRGPSAFSFAL